MYQQTKTPEDNYLRFPFDIATRPCHWALSIELSGPCSLTNWFKTEEGGGEGMIEILACHYFGCTLVPRPPTATPLATAARTRRVNNVTLTKYGGVLMSVCVLKNILKVPTNINIKIPSVHRHLIQRTAPIRISAGPSIIIGTLTPKITSLFARNRKQNNKPRLDPETSKRWRNMAYLREVFVQHKQLIGWNKQRTFQSVRNWLHFRSTNIQKAPVFTSGSRRHQDTFARKLHSLPLGGAASVDQ